MKGGVRKTERKRGRKCAEIKGRGTERKIVSIKWKFLSSPLGSYPGCVLLISSFFSFLGATKSNFSQLVNKSAGRPLHYHGIIVKKKKEREIKNKKRNQTECILLSLI